MTSESIDPGKPLVSMSDGDLLQVNATVIAGTLGVGLHSVDTRYQDVLII
jgi:hypothetical protein